MDKIANDQLSLWREEGSRLVPQNFEVFSSLVAQARDFVQRGEYDMAAVYAQIASSYVFTRHSGIFASPELEQVLLMIGQKAIRSKHYSSKSTSLPGKIKHVLHVTTGVWGIGGHSRLLWRWIQQDNERVHSVVLTRQSLTDTPKLFRDAVLNSHGKVYVLEETVGSFVSWAKRLREIAASMDMVVLHTIQDIIPVIAFANKEQSPPVIFVNHADERIWMGVGISDVVANLRESGMRLSLERRGIEPERNALLPIILNPISRKLSRAEAKRQLGLFEDSIVLLSIARADKYKTIDGISFADAHVTLLKQHEQAVLLVIGPGDSEDWSGAIEQTQGRIRVFGHTENTAVFYQAADIYVDSFPWISNTSLLEAGSYGVPLVTRYPYTSSACEIFGADMPGLTGNLIRVQNLKEYTAVLSHLVEDENFRLSLGEATRSKIVETHIGKNWQRSLENLYSLAATLPRINAVLTTRDQMSLTEMDLLLPTVIFRQNNPDLEQMILDSVRLMPLKKRFSIWLKQLKTGDFGRMGHISFLLPLWLYRRLQH
ncbi:glycosyltransferase family 4 protein [Nostoc sp. CENA67]|uniref:Glycosyltransferase family 4 protein n=1 Tax=Amazonocrinis nigriterrae CENA67 TaxID=2794033 RepID=A0A8J7HK30_9NOST|nr:glycosyltransferase family 4 protein [Amazonocrinis nigriterrae]MBH8561052.1 glycosyltransferase family 4 protein [Amazonocrinis nigriterrae CENA67]